MDSLNVFSVDRNFMSSDTTTTQDYSKYWLQHQHKIKNDIFLSPLVSLFTEVPSLISTVWLPWMENKEAIHYTCSLNEVTISSITPRLLHPINKKGNDPPPKFHSFLGDCRYKGLESKSHELGGCQRATAALWVPWEDPWVVFKALTLESVISVQDLQLITWKWHAPAVGIRVGQTGNR